MKPKALLLAVALTILVISSFALGSCGQGNGESATPSPVLPTSPASASIGNVFLLFESEVSDDDRRLILDATEMTMRFFASHGIEPTARWLVTAKGTGNGQLATARPGLAEVNTALWQVFSDANRSKIMIHELVHLYQFKGDLRAYTRELGPDWLIEGAAEYLAFMILHWAGRLDFPSARACYIGPAISDAARLLPDLSRITLGQSHIAYSLSATAVDTLVEGTNYHLVVAYYAYLHDGLAPELAFEQVFGQRVASFEAEFEQIRSNLRAPSNACPPRVR